MALLKFFFATSILGSLVDATPIVDYPINAQVPPVARISQPFSYSFAPSTFSSTSQIKYSLSGGPTWLSLDSNSRILSGTPSSSDAGPGVVTGVPIDITATDETGSVTLNATLVVSTNPAPTVRIPVSEQLSGLDNFAAPSKLLYHPSTPFSFKFDPETFLDNATGLNYYAVSQNNTPLPSWVTFDSDSLSFSGETPDVQSLIQPPQVFGFRLVASDVEGFLGTSVTFEIEVGVHLFSFSDAALQFNATTGDDITFNGLSNNLQLDGASPNSSSIVSVIATVPSWLIFDNITLLLTGVAPDDTTSYNVTVQATDIYGDTANASVYIDIRADIFSKQIEALNATIGKPFSYSFENYLTNSTDVNMTAQILPDTLWLSFNPANFTLAGQVPDNMEETDLTVTLVAVSKSTKQSASESFELSVVTAVSSQSSTSAPPSSTSVSTSSSVVSTATSTTEAAATTGHRGLSGGIIAAIVVPVVVAFIALLACICCCLWRKRRSKRQSGSPSKSDISAPIEARSSQDPQMSPIPRTRPPEKLQLDTSGFIVDRNSKGYTYIPKGGIKRHADGTVRRSQTMSMISDVQDTSEMRDSQSSTNRLRSYSENALSKTDSSWRSTQGSSSNQDSAYPMIGSRSSSSNILGSSNNYSISRNYSNYSRKGRARRSTLRGSTDRYLRDSSHSLRPATGQSILNLGDSSFSSTPLDNFSVLSDQSSMQQTPEMAYAAGRPRREVDSSKRYSRFFPLDRQRSGVGHGARESISSSFGNFSKRRSVGHGRDWIPTAGASGPLSHDLAKDPTWHTIHTSDDSNENNRRSAASNMTESTDLLYPGDQRLMSIKQVPMSPVASSSAAFSESSIAPRPLSRRTMGESPFFGGGASRFARKSPRALKENLYETSSTVPEEHSTSSQQDLEQSIIHSLRRQSDGPRDSFGISYGTPREGTERLRSFINTRLGRTGTQNSMMSNMSRDSRFESANPSAYSHDPDIPGSRDGATGDNAEGEWEDYLPEEYSQGSWEQHSPHRDSRGNIIEYAADDSPHLELAAAQAAVRPQLLSPNSESMHTMADIGPNARVIPGAGRRPISVDTNWKREYSQSADQMDQEDYKTYI